MEGEISGAVAGKLRLTQLGVGGPDDVNVLVVRGVLDTADGASIYCEIDGRAIARGDERDFLNILKFRTSDERYRWLNTAIVVVEGTLAGGTARSKLFRIEHEATAEP